MCMGGCGGNKTPKTTPQGSNSNGRQAYTPPIRRGAGKIIGTGFGAPKVTNSKISFGARNR